MTHPVPTIYALSSGHGRAGIAVVRMSGPLSGHVLTALSVHLPEPRKATLSTLRTFDGEIIDQAVLLWFPGPSSATGEDVAEFHLHGSSVLVEFLFDQFAKFDGLQPAEPGAFSRRAFQNGKLDLVEVEGLADLLSATGDAQRRLAMRQFLGEASAVYESWRADVIEALALHEAAIDFVEEDDVSARARALAEPVIVRLIRKLETALSVSGQNAAVRSGLRVVFAGAPNVGKSSLLNALVGRDAAIVSPVAGTTRDVIEAQIMFEGLPLIVTDTAGLRSVTSDEIEALGIDRAKVAADSADVVIWVTAPSIPDLVGPSRQPDIMVHNKADLVSIRDRNVEGLYVSARTGEGMDDLRLALRSLIQSKTDGVEQAVVVRQRHIFAVRKTIRLLNDCVSRTDRPHELLVEDLRGAAQALGSVTGHIDVEDLLTKIFSEFCIGK